MDARYNLRPELIESMYYIYKATGARGGRGSGVQGRAGRARACVWASAVVVVRVCEMERLLLCS